MDQDESMNVSDTDSVSLSDSISVSVSDSGSDTDSDMAEEWKRVSEELERLSTFHSSILDRMEKLSIRTSTLDSNMHKKIQDCYHTSLDDLEKTGEVTFGQRLLQWFDCGSTSSATYHTLPVKN
jgi:hypothetical protein